MDEADSHLELLLLSTLDIYTVFEHIDLFWSKNDVITLWLKSEGYLKLLPPSILDIFKVFEHIDMLSIGIQ